MLPGFTVSGHHRTTRCSWTVWFPARLIRIGTKPEIRINMDLVLIASRIGALFILMGLGFAAARIGIVTRSGARVLTSALVNITLPALILVSMQIPLTPDRLGSTAVIFGIAAVYYVIAFGLAWTVPRLLAGSERERGVLGFMLVFSNLGFMGYPVADALFGSESFFYVSLINLPFGLLVFSAGVVMLRPDLGRHFDARLFLSPGIIASVLGLAFFLAGVAIPSPVFEVLDLAGSVTTPLAMIVIGSFIASVSPVSIFSDRRLYIISALRLLVIPVLLYLVIRPFVTDPLLLGIPVILAAMPAAANTVLLAEEYRSDAGLASEGVFISTMLCIVTIPLIALLVV